MRKQINLVEQKQIVTRILQDNLKPKSLLVFGEGGVGKSTLLNHARGQIFNVDYDEELGQTILVGGGEPLKPVSYKQGLIVDLHITQHQSGEHGEISIIQMPALSSCPSDYEPEEELKLKMLKLFIWASVMQLVQQVAITIVLPYNYLAEQENLRNYMKFWEKIANHSSSQKLDAIRKSISFTFSKVSYEDDKDEYVTYLKDLIKASEISINNSFIDAVDNDRMHCFIAQDTQEGEGQDLIERILNCQMLQNPAQTFFSCSWAYEAISFSLKGEMTDTLAWRQKIPLDEQESILKQIAVKIFNQAKTVEEYSVLGRSICCKILYDYLQKYDNSPKKSTMADILNQIKKQLDETPKYLTKMTKSIPRMSDSQSTQLFLKVHRKIVESGQPQCEETVYGLVDGLLREFQEEFRTIVKNQVFFSWILEDTAKFIAENSEDSEFCLVFLKEIGSDFKEKLRKKFIDFMKSLNMMEKLSEVGDLVCQKPEFTDFMLIYSCGDEQEVQYEEIVQEQETRIKRNYLTDDFYDQKIKQLRASILPSEAKHRMTVIDKTSIKELLNSIERDRSPELIGDLFGRALQIYDYQLAFQCIIQLNAYEQMVQMVVVFFENLQTLPFDEIQSKKEFIVDKMVRYLYQSAKTSESVEAQKEYYNALSRSYEFLACELCETVEEYQEIQDLIQQITVEMEQNLLPYPKPHVDKKSEISISSAVKDKKVENLPSLTFLNLEVDRKREIVERFETKQGIKNKYGNFIKIARKLMADIQQKYAPK